VKDTTQHSQFQLGISKELVDIRKVVELGITPIINTGIAHKNAGVGQIGAGTVRAPLGCFEKALEAYAEKLGITVE